MWRLTGHTTMRLLARFTMRGRRSSSPSRNRTDGVLTNDITFGFGWFSKKAPQGRPVWLGSVTFDRGVGFSHDTGQVTHHIGPNIDAERDLLMHDLAEAGMVQTFFQISGTGPTLFGRNGEGDPYYTDGEIDFASLVVGGVKRTEPPATLPPPPLIALKDRIWHGVSNAVSQ